MRLSTRARYALRVMLDIARHGGGERPVPLTAVAHRTDLSHGYLEQLVLGLRQARILRGVAGRKGGYMLAREPREIRLGAVVEASIGQICVVECVRDPAVCARAGRCETRVLYGLLNRRIEETLESLSLADLMDPDWLALNGGIELDALAEVPEGPDPCSAPRGPRRGRPRGRQTAGAREAAERSPSE